MRSKHIVTMLLLAVAIGSLAYMGIREAGSDAKQPVPETPDPPIQPMVAAEPGPAPRTVVAYYFHGDKRCDTCLKLEGYAKEAIDTHFPDELEAGTLQWRTVNVDEAEHEHFVQDFSLVTKAVVLVTMDGDKQADWRNLDRIWDLVGDKAAYMDYVRENTREVLQAAS